MTSQMSKGVMVADGMKALASLRRLTSEALREERQASERDVALSLAVKEGQSALARRLVAEGADPDKSSALIWAAERESDALARFLLKAGACPDGSPFERVVTPLGQAARCGRLKTVEALLGAGARVNLRVLDLEADRPASSNRRSVSWKSDMTPLMWAASAGQADCARALLRAGADPKIQSASGETARAMAVACGSLEIAAELLAAEQREELDKITAGAGEERESTRSARL